MEKKKTVHDFEFIGRILDILKILQEETDECTTITQPEILELMEKHEHPCSARTLTDYLKVMMKELNPEEDDGYVDIRYTMADYKIIAKGLEAKIQARDLGLVEEGKKKLQLRSLRYNQLFSFEELNQIVEAVLFLKSIDPAEKEKLICKLQTLSSVNYPKYSPFITQTTGKISKSFASFYEDSRVDEAAVHQNLKLIRAAIEADHGSGRKIAFNFNTYNEEKQLVPKKNSKGEDMVYVASPYHVILYNGKFYMIGNVDPFDNVSFYRVDLMTNITDRTKRSPLNNGEFVPERRKPKRQIKGMPLEWTDETASKFQTEHMYMYYGKPCTIRLKIDKHRYTLLHDYFGNRYKFIGHVDDCRDEVEVVCVPKAMEAWAMQCSDFIEVLSPDELRTAIKEKCQRLAERYR